MGQSQAPMLFDNRYRLEIEVGQGGMAVVYRGYDERLGRPVAVKVMRAQFASDPNFLARFRREAQAVANLSHPNLVAVFDTGEVNGVPYIVMEYVDGDNLKTRIAAEAPFSAERSVSVMIQTCEGVGAAHRAGLVHRDLKPQNILLTRTGQVKVSDFGIAHSLSATSVSSTQTGQVWGTAQYIAPEQAQGQPVTPATDVYSLGVTLFELLTARLPFEGDTAFAVAMQHLQAEPPTLRSFNPTVPLGLEGIVAKAMAKRPAARYPDADAFCSALKAYQRLGEQVTGPIPIATRASVAQPVARPPSSVATPAQPGTGVRPVVVAAAAQPGAPAGVTLAPPKSVVKAEADWITIALGTLAVLAVIGLLPLYWSIIQRFNIGP